MLAVSLIPLARLAYVLVLRMMFPWDLFMWSESPFMTNMLKLSAAHSIYGPPSDASSFVYSQIARSGVNYALKRQKTLKKCLLLGGTKASCLAHPTIQNKLTKAETRKKTDIKTRCGNRQPIASPPFCCRTGQANQCLVATSRDDCTMNLAGQVQEGKICDMGNCTPQGAPHAITWWQNCPESDTCPGTALATLDDLIACVDTSADAITDELLTLQFPASYPSPTELPDATPTPAAPTPTVTPTP